MPGVRTYGLIGLLGGVLSGIAGMYLGQKLTPKIANARLQKIFAVGLALMAVTMLVFHFFVQV